MQILLVCGFAIACADRTTGSVASRAGALERDSAGVTIVENHADTAHLQLWKVRLAEAIRLGNSPGKPHEEFTEVVAAFRLSDDRIAVVEASTSEVRYFSATGTYLRSSGRRGQGPGEYQRIQSAYRSDGDSIILWDSAARRVTLLSPNGDVVRTADISTPATVLKSGAVIRGPGLRSVISGFDGAWISVDVGLHIPPDKGALPVLVNEPTILLRHEQDGDLSDSIAVALGNAQLFAPPGTSVEQGPFRAAEPMSPSWTLKTFVSHGPAVTFVASSNEFDVTAIKRDGDVVWRSRYGRIERKFEKAEADSIRRRSLSNATSPDRLRAMEYMTDTKFVPPFWPTLGALQADHAGRIWLRSWQRGAHADSWLILDSAGRALATAETPRSMSVLSIDIDHVVGMERDAMGTPYVIVAPIVRTPRE